MRAPTYIVIVALQQIGALATQCDTQAHENQADLSKSLVSKLTVENAEAIHNLCTTTQPNKNVFTHTFSKSTKFVVTTDGNQRPNPTDCLSTFQEILSACVANGQIGGGKTVLHGTTYEILIPGQKGSIGHEKRKGGSKPTKTTTKKNDPKTTTTKAATTSSSKTTSSTSSTKATTSSVTSSSKTTSSAVTPSTKITSSKTSATSSGVSSGSVTSSQKSTISSVKSSSMTGTPTSSKVSGSPTPTLTPSGKAKTCKQVQALLKKKLGSTKAQKREFPHWSERTHSRSLLVARGKKSGTYCPSHYAKILNAEDYPDQNEIESPRVSFVSEHSF
jgi:hypothetical protein